jgi:hypothetical protein
MHQDCLRTEAERPDKRWLLQSKLKGIHADWSRDDVKKTSERSWRDGVFRSGDREEGRTIRWKELCYPSLPTPDRRSRENRVGGVEIEGIHAHPVRS